VGEIKVNSVWVVEGFNYKISAWLLLFLESLNELFIDQKI